MRQDREGIWRDLADACNGIADALESGDDILGALASRNFVLAASELEPTFWKLLEDEMVEGRKYLAELAAEREPESINSYLSGLS